MKVRIILLLLVLSCFNRASLASGEQWIEVSSAHFTVVANTGEKEARRLLDQFERMRWTFQKLTPHANSDSEMPLLIIAVKNQKSFDALLPPDRRAKNQLQLAGFFLRGESRNYVLLRLDAEQQHPYATIYHEYTHMQFRKIEDWMPLWLNEGLAQFYQNTVIHDKNAELGQANVNDILFLRQNRLIPLETLFAVDRDSPYYHEENKGNIFYAESWALTHYLMINDFDNKTNHIKDYLLLVGQGNDPVSAATKAFGNLKDLTTQLEYYIRSGNYRELVLNTAAAPLDESSYKLRPLSQPEVAAAEAEILMHEGQLNAAKTMLDSVLKESPQDADALEERGTIALHENDHVEALRMYDEAYKLGCQRQGFLDRYVMLRMSTGLNAGQKAEVEAVLRKEIGLYPHSAAAYDRLASMIRIDPKRMEEARQLELQAIDADPAEFHYRLNMESLLLSMDKLDDARAVLSAARKLFTTASQQQLLDLRLKQIDSIVESRKQAAVEAARPQPEVSVESSVSTPSDAPKHPTAPASGPKHTIDGVIHGVVCNYPSQMDLTVETPKKTFKLYNMNYFKVEYSAINFKPSGSLDPCSMMDGLHAKVVYAENPADASVDGEMQSVALRK